MGREKTSGPHDQLAKSAKISQTKEASVGEVSRLYLVPRRPCVPWRGSSLGADASEAEASQSKLISGPCVIRKKKNPPVGA